MSDRIFVIKNDNDNCVAIYSDIEKAKNELKNIYNESPDYKYQDWHISIYKLVDGEYVIEIGNRVYYNNGSFDNIN